MRTQKDKTKRGNRVANCWRRQPTADLRRPWAMSGLLLHVQLPADAHRARPQMAAQGTRVTSVGDLDEVSSSWLHSDSVQAGLDL